MSQQKFLCLLFAVFTVATAQSQSSPVGVWKTIDDETGEAKSHVEIYQKDDAYFGKIVKLLQRAPDVLCEQCKGEKKDQPILGMVIIEGLKAHKDYWRKGSILDPENGNEYNCSVWFEEDATDQLKVRGKHWTGLYRTQTWYRVR